MNQRRRDSDEPVSPELEALCVQRTAMSLSALNWKPFVYRGLTSTLAEFSKFPVDLTKTRLQIQDQKNDADFKEIKY